MRITKSQLRQMIQEAILAEQATLAMSHPGISPAGNLATIMPKLLPSLRWSKLKNGGVAASFNPFQGGKFNLQVEISPDARDGGYKLFVHAPQEAEVERYSQYPVEESQLKQEAIQGMAKVIRSLFVKTTERVKDL